MEITEDKVFPLVLSKQLIDSLIIVLRKSGSYYVVHLVGKVNARKSGFRREVKFETTSEPLTINQYV